jgi:hypothetical protein
MAPTAKKLEGHLYPSSGPAAKLLQRCIKKYTVDSDRENFSISRGNM